MAMPAEPLFIDWLNRAGLGVKASYRPGEVAALLACSPRTVRRMADDGRLTGIVLRGHRRITFDSLLAYYLDA